MKKVGTGLDVLINDSNLQKKFKGKIALPVYNTNVGHSPRRFTTGHRSILHATKSKENNFYKDNVLYLIKILPTNVFKDELQTDI